MERMALQQSFKSDPDSLHDSKTLNWHQSVRRTTGSKSAGRSNENWKWILIKMDEKDESSLNQSVNRSSFHHNIKSFLSSSSASLYRLTEHPFLASKTISKDPLIWCLFRRKNSRIYRLIRFRKMAGPISFLTTIPNRWSEFLFSLKRRIKFLEACLLPVLITFLKTWGSLIFSFLVNRNNPST